MHITKESKVMLNVVCSTTRFFRTVYAFSETTKDEL